MFDLPPPSAQQRIKELEEDLARAQQELRELRDRAARAERAAREAWPFARWTFRAERLQRRG